MPGDLEVNAAGISLLKRQSHRAATDTRKHEELSNQRARRLRRKLLAKRVVAHWKNFAREGIAAARARSHASRAPQRRALARWRAAVFSLRARRVARIADTARRRFLAESRGLATWAAATRAKREHRLRREATVAGWAEGAGLGLSHPEGIRAAHALRRWRAELAKRRESRAAESAASAHHARRSAAVAFATWRRAVAEGADRHRVETIALKAWAKVRLRRGLAALRRHAERSRWDGTLRRRADAVRDRVLALKGLGALDTSVLTAVRLRDAAAQVEASRVRTALQRWRVAAMSSRALKTVLAEQAVDHASQLRPGRLRRAIGRWRLFREARKRSRLQLTRTATLPLQLAGAVAWDSHSVVPVERPGELSVPVGRVCAQFALRHWWRALQEREEMREAMALADGFRNHVLLLRHHEAWKAAIEGQKAAAAAEAAVEGLSRRSRLRRALLAMASGAETAAEEREAARPRLQEVFHAWEAYARERGEKRSRRDVEEAERRRRLIRKALLLWRDRARRMLESQSRVSRTSREFRLRCLGQSLRSWSAVSTVAKRLEGNRERAERHLRRRTLSAGLGRWRNAAAVLALRRGADETAKKWASRSLTAKVVNAWRERAMLQVTRKAVFRARVASAAGVLSVGKVRRSFWTWEERHRASQVAAITLLRAEEHARCRMMRGALGVWMRAHERERSRKAFGDRVRSRRRMSLLRRTFGALATAAEAGRLEQAKVTAALLLWKFHMQRKAFAALAAYRLRRQQKAKRARRALEWRRGMLVREGTSRWAATADALVASRISLAANREAKAAARRWEAVGRCARHWRRVAASRAMERRTREARGGVAGPGLSGRSQSASVGVRFEGDLGAAGRRSRSRYSIKDREIVEKYGSLGRGNQGISGGETKHDMDFFGDYRWRPRARHLSTSAPSHSSRLRNFVTEGSQQPIHTAGIHQRAAVAGVEKNQASVSRRRAGGEEPRVPEVLTAGAGVKEGVGGRRRGAPGTGEDIHDLGGEQLGHCGDSGRLEVRQLGATETETPAVSRRGSREREAVIAGGTGSFSGMDRGDGENGDLCGDERSRSRRPPPRRPVELLFDNLPCRGGASTRTSAVTAAGKGPGSSSAAELGLIRDADGRLRQPIPAWVVDEMNRLYGVRGVDGMVGHVPGSRSRSRTPLPMQGAGRGDAVVRGNDRRGGISVSDGPVVSSQAKGCNQRSYAVEGGLGEPPVNTVHSSAGGSVIAGGNNPPGLEGNIRCGEPNGPRGSDDARNFIRAQLPNGEGGGVALPPAEDAQRRTGVGIIRGNGMDCRRGLRADSAGETRAGRSVPQQGLESQGYAGWGRRESGVVELDVDRKADSARGGGDSRGILEGPAHPASGLKSAIAFDEHVVVKGPGVTPGDVAVGTASLSAPLLYPEGIPAASTLARIGYSDSATVVSGDSLATATRSVVEAAVRSPRGADEGQAAISAEECPGTGVPAHLDGAENVERQPVKSIERAYLLREKREQIQEGRQPVGRSPEQVYQEQKTQEQIQEEGQPVRRSLERVHSKEETPEQILEAKVIEAERRLRFLQEQKRRRREHRRELAALHKALSVPPNASAGLKESREKARETPLLGADNAGQGDRRRDGGGGGGSQGSGDARSEETVARIDGPGGMAIIREPVTGGGIPPGGFDPPEPSPGGGRLIPDLVSSRSGCEVAAGTAVRQASGVRGGVAVGGGNGVREPSGQTLSPSHGDSGRADIVSGRVSGLCLRDDYANVLAVSSEDHEGRMEKSVEFSPALPDAGDVEGSAREARSRPSRASLLVQMGVVRSRLGAEAGGMRKEKLRPVAEKLRRDVEELRESLGVSPR